MNVRRQTADEAMQKEHEQAAKCFANHQIVSRDDRSWTLHAAYKKDPPGWDWTFWYEVIVFKNGTLFVHGDFDHVLFGTYGGPMHPERVLRWMGACKDFGYYVRQKAVIGMGSARDCLSKKDENVFFDHLLHHIEETDAVRTDSRKLSPIPEFETHEELLAHLQKEIDFDALEDWLREALEGVVSGREMNEIEHDMEHAGTQDPWDAGAFEWGEVPSSRLVYAYQALRRLVQLLDEEHDRATEQKKESVGDGG